MKKILAFLSFLCALTLFGCLDEAGGGGSDEPACEDVAGAASASGTYVDITNSGNYFSVTIDYTGNPDRQAVGTDYANQIKQVVPSFECYVDSYLNDATADVPYAGMKSGALDLITRIPADYRSEIDGMATALEDAPDTSGDGKLSRNELYILNLLPDVRRTFACSGLSVWGSLSAGGMMTARALDWDGGSESQLSRLHAVVTLKYGSGQSVCLIGYLGFMGVITGFNSAKVFAAILDSPTFGAFSTTGRQSYPMDLRVALETQTSADGVAQYMVSPATSVKYTFNHNILVSDPTESKVVEYNFSDYWGTVYTPRVRTANAPLRSAEYPVSWAHAAESICVVNSFVLGEHFNNHNNPLSAMLLGEDITAINYLRWNNFSTLFDQRLSGSTLTLGELEEIISYDGDTNPNGKIFNAYTQQVIVFQPDTLSAEVYFRPVTGQLADPVFEPVTAGF